MPQNKKSYKMKLIHLQEYRNDFFQIQSQPKTQLIEPKKAQIDPPREKKIKKLDNKKIFKMKFTESPKKFSDLTPTPKIARQGPKRFKMTPKRQKIRKSENKICHKIKVISLNEYTPKKFLGPTPAPKNARQGPKRLKMTPKRKNKEVRKKTLANDN